MREMLMTKLSRGKVDIRINLNRAGPAANAGALNRDTLSQLAALERSVLEKFPGRGTHAHRRNPALARRARGRRRVAGSAARSGAGMRRAAIADLIDVREREGAALEAMLVPSTPWKASLNELPH